MKIQFWSVVVLLSGSFMMAQNVPATPADSPAAAGSSSSGSSVNSSSVTFFRE